MKAMLNKKSTRKINKCFRINITYPAKKFRHNLEHCSCLFFQDIEGKNQEIRWCIKDVRLVYSSSKWPVAKQKASRIEKSLNRKSERSSRWLDWFKNRHVLVYKYVTGETARVNIADAECLENQRASVNFQSIYWFLYLQCGQVWTVHQSNELISDETFDVKRYKHTRRKFTKDRVIVGRNVDGTENIKLVWNPHCFKK